LGDTGLPPPNRTTVDGPSTEVLLHRALVEGDHAALERVVSRLRPEMLRLAERYVRSSDDAEDVVQDAWIAALAGIERFEARASLKTWLLRILTYRARSASRRGGRFISLSQLPAVSAPARQAFEQETAFVSSVPDPAEVAVVRDLRNRIEEALAELPRRQREVVRLRDLEGWSPGEVSSRLRVSAGNQRVLLHRGRLQLREAVVSN